MKGPRFGRLKRINRSNASEQCSNRSDAESVVATRARPEPSGRGDQTAVANLHGIPARETSAPANRRKTPPSPGRSYTRNCRLPTSPVRGRRRAGEPGVSRSVRPVRTPATQTAHAPVPHASVMPLPRSQVRIVTSLGECTFTKWTFTRRGNSRALPLSDPNSATRSRSTRCGRTHPRRYSTTCGLPIETQVAANRVPADRQRRVHRRVAAEASSGSRRTSISARPCSPSRGSP